MKSASVCDGTYIYCEKSSDNYLQRALFSGHKKRHLVKPFVLCFTNWYIIDVFGLYSAKINDSTILIDLLKNNQNLKRLLLQKNIQFSIEVSVTAFHN